MIPLQYALRRRMMINVSKGLPISDLPLGTLINIGTDGGAGTSNYEIADINNLVPGGVVLVRKNIYSESQFGSPMNYPNSTLDNLIKSTIYNQIPQKIRDKMMDVTFNLSGSGDITRKIFAPTYTMAGFGNNNGVAEGKALQLYTSNDSRVKTFNGSTAIWWLSSQSSTGRAWCVYVSGSAENDYDYSSISFGVVPAFVIPSETPYDPIPNQDGSYNLIPMVTLTLTGSFDNSGLFGERYVAVDGDIITELGTYNVMQDSTIILHTKISPVMGGNEKYGIFVNNKCVRTAVQCINHGPDYEYLLVSNCTINGQGKVHERGGYARIDVTT